MKSFFFQVISQYSNMPGQSCLVLLAEGSEEMETVIVVDILRRAKVDVVLAGLGQELVTTCSRSIKIVADCLLQDVNDVFDCVVLPGGGKGAEIFANSKIVRDVLEKHQAAGKLVAAICAAPTALLAHNIGIGKKITSYPAFKDQLSKDYNYSEDRVVVDGKLVTSQGPGTTFEFAFKLVELLLEDTKVADELKSQTLALTP